MISDRFRRWAGEVLSPRQFTDKIFWRFIAVGCSNFVVSFSVFWLCLRVPVTLQYKASASQLVAYAVATLWSFFWNRRLTFKSSGPVVLQARRFITLQVVLAFVSSALVGLGIDRFGLPPKLWWFSVMVNITAANYLLSKWWAFRQIE